MKFNEYSEVAHRILALEFTDRDRDIQAGVTCVKQQLNARGVLHSTMTVQSLAEFFLAEFEARLQHVAEHATSALRSDDASIPGSTGAPVGVELFRSLAVEQLDVIRKAYDGSAEAVVASLQSNLPDQIRSNLLERMHTEMQKRGLAVEREYKLAVNQPREMLTLRPTIYCSVRFLIEPKWNCSLQCFTSVCIGAVNCELPWRLS